MPINLRMMKASTHAMLVAAILCGVAPALIWAADAPANKAPAGAENPAEKKADAATKSASPNAEADDLDRWLPTSNWEVLFDENEGMTAIEYARRLDYFGIELAAVAKNGQVQYASRLADPKPARRVGQLDQDPRINMNWKRGNLAALEAKLMLKAGINTKDKTLTHFYPKAVEARLARLERTYAGRDPRDIRRTRFKVRLLENQPKVYEFYVEEQDAQESGSQNSPGSSDSPPQKPKRSP